MRRSIPWRPWRNTDAALEQVLREIQISSEYVAAILDEPTKEAGGVPGEDQQAEPEPLPGRYQILIKFASDAAKALEKLTAEGYACRSLIC